jgi:hypothetical protein
MPMKFKINQLVVLRPDYCSIAGKEVVAIVTAKG